MKMALSPVGTEEIRITESFRQFLRVHHTDHILGNATL